MAEAAHMDTRASSTHTESKLSEFICLEHPCIVKNPENLIKSIGCEHVLDALHPEESLAIDLSLGNRSVHPMYARPEAPVAFVARLHVPVEFGIENNADCGGSRPQATTADGSCILGTISRIYRHPGNALAESFPVRPPDQHVSNRTRGFSVSNG
jgi:hypothetical protein